MPRYIFTVPIGPGPHPLLHQTLASLAAQGGDVRVAICHAGRRDEIVDVLEAHASLVAYERHGPDDGQSAAINEGWRALEGDVYGWLNADDALAPNALSVANALFQRDPDADIVCGQSVIFDTDGRFRGLHPNVKAPDADLLRSNTISQPSCFVKRAALDEVGFLDEQLHYVMDWDLWVRLFTAGRRFSFTEDALSAVLFSTDTKTGGLGGRRLREISGVIAQNHGPVAQMKAFVGFSIQHLTEYSRLSKPIKAFRGWLNSGRVQSLTYWGDAKDNDFRLNFFHYSQSPVAGVRLRFTRRALREISLDREFAKKSDGLAVDVYSPFPAGGVLEIAITGDGFHPADIELIELI